MLHAAAAGAPQPKPVPKWKAEHEEFMANLKAARQYDAAGVLPHPCVPAAHALPYFVRRRD